MDEVPTIPGIVSPTGVWAQARSAKPVRHSAVVRITHWLTALCFLALLVTGIEIVISHPRFYWGEEGNVNTPPLISLPIPSSRESVPTGYGYVLPDQNGWSRSLHFQSAWLTVLTGLVYVLTGWTTGHFRKNLMPSRAELSMSSLGRLALEHMRLRRSRSNRAYNPLQRITYLFVIFGAFPAMIWTGLAMSPAVTSAWPFLVTMLGGHQSARTLHFIGTLGLVLFLVVHVLMICLSGFWGRTRAMITGSSKEENQ